MEKSNRYIGFGIRFIAAAIDSIIFFIAFWILGKFFIFIPISLIKITILGLAFNIIAEAIYEIFLTSKFGGTVGKILMKCKVIDFKGNNISLTDSTARYFSKWLSTLTMGVGYLIIIWDPKKQGLHDKIASTYVVADSKSCIKQSLKNVLITVTLIIVIGYILSNIYFGLIGGVVGFQIGSKDIKADDPLNSVITICDLNIPYYKAVCISQFSKMKEIEKLNASARLELCSNINSKQFHNECIVRIAVSERNQSICDNAKSNYYTTICKKVYNFTHSVVDYFFKEEKLKFNGTLNVDDTVLGILAGDKCIEVEANDFTFDDNFCIIFTNIGPLEKGEDGFYWFDLGLWIYDDKGRLINSFDKFLDKEGHIEPSDNLFNNNFLKKHTLELTLGKTIAKEGPGTYTYDIAVYDRISNKGKYVNKTLKVAESYNKKLTIKNSLFGVMAEDQGCVSKSNNIYTKKDSICLTPYNISKFDKNHEGFYLFDMDLFIRNSTRGIVADGKDIYDEDGLIVLKDGILNPIADKSEGVKQSLELLSQGNYTFELVVKDKIGKKEAKIKKNFVIVENKDKLKVERYHIGHYDGLNCIKRPLKTFSDENIICFQPFVTNFEEDSNGMIHFNMDQTVFDAHGEPVYYGKDEFGNDGEQVTAPLFGYYVYEYLSDYSPGEYVYEIAVKDLISKEIVTITDKFTVEEEAQIFETELDKFTQKYRNAIVDTLVLGETKTYTINWGDYEVLSIYIGPEGARLMINGWVSDWLIEGETQKLPNGEVLMVSNIFKTESGDAVEFALGR